MTFLLHLLLATAVPADCHPVEGDRISGADLAKAIPAFAELPPELTLGYGPMPGTSRILRPDELLRIAKAHGIAGGSWTAECFATPMLPLADSTVVEAMIAALGVEAVIEVRHLDPRLVPKGKLTFPRSSLGRPPRGDSGEKLIWRGYVQYAENRRYAVVAAVSIRAALTRVVARESLIAGRIIGTSSVRTETYRGFPGTEQPAATLDEVIGRLPRRSIRVDEAVYQSELVPAPAVRKGERVQVNVTNGAAHLELEGQVETDGRVGDWIQVRNLQSGKQFRAQVQANGKVVVVPKGIEK